MANCSDCPSFVSQYDVARQEAAFGTNTGADVCPRKSLVLGLPSMPADKRLERREAIASSCAEYGKPETPRITQMVKLGIPTIEAPADDGSKISTCRSCYFYVDTKTSQSFTGLNMGVCARFATLLPPTKLTTIGKNCRTGVRYQPADEGPMVPLEAVREKHLEMLKASIVFDPSLVNYIGAVGESESEGVQHQVIFKSNPNEYETDREVTPAQEAQGIRAWRKLERGGKQVYLPIFRGDYFDDNERAKIPQTGDDEHPDQYVDHMGLTFTVAVLWRELDETPALHGVAGTGKTEFFRYMAWLMQLPFERISITRSTELDDLAGMTLFENDQTVFKKGRVPVAWAKPCIVCLDEPNVGSPDVWQFLRPMTDSSKQLVLDSNQGEVVRRHPHSYLGMAMNPAWDARNIGAEVLSDADGSRLMHIAVDLPDEKIERSIITERCKVDGYDIEKWMLDRLIKIGKDLRDLSDNGTLPVTWGIRPQLKVARATAWFDLRAAYLLAAGDYLEPSVREMILDVVQNHHK